VFLLLEAKLLLLEIWRHGKGIKWRRDAARGGSIGRSVVGQLLEKMGLLNSLGIVATPLIAYALSEDSIGSDSAGSVNVNA